MLFRPAPRSLLPADTPHDIEMDGPVQMRALFLRKSAAAKIGERTAVYAVTPFLRELILAACVEPLDWDLDGRGHHIAALALDEIEASTVLPMALVKPADPRLRRVTDALARTPTDDRSLEDWAEIVGATSRTLMRLFRSETGDELSPVATSLAPYRGIYRTRDGCITYPSRRHCRFQFDPCIRCCLSRSIRVDARSGASKIFTDK